MPNFIGIQSADYAIFVLSVLFVAFIVNRILRFLIRRFIIRNSAELRSDPTHYFFLYHAVNLLVFLVALIIILYSIPEFREVGVSLFAGAGILAAIIGFASQAAFSNIVGGVFIVIFKPFRVGDYVKVGTQYAGMIEDITLRHTVIRDFENRRFVVPNSVISTDTIHNSSLINESIGNFVIMRISYSADINHAMRIMIDEAMKHRFLIDPRNEVEVANSEPIVDIRVINLSEYSVDIRMKCWTEDFLKGFELKTELYKILKERFDKEGVELALPFQKIQLKNDGQNSEE